MLAHADLRPSNIIVDEQLCIKGIIDWEWAGTVPLQFFMPPTWIAGRLPDEATGVFYQIEYRRFFDVLQAKSAQLAKEWGRKLPTEANLPMAIALRRHSCFIGIYYRALFPLFYRTPIRETIGQFFDRDGIDGSLTLEVQRRVKDSEEYGRYLNELLEEPQAASPRLQLAPENPTGLLKPSSSFSSISSSSSAAFIASLRSSMTPLAGASSSSIAIT